MADEHPRLQSTGRGPTSPCRHSPTFLLMSHTRTLPSAPPVTALPFPMLMEAQVTGPVCHPSVAIKSSVFTTCHDRKRRSWVVTKEQVDYCPGAKSQSA